MSSYNYQEISNWMRVSDSIDASAVSFIVELAQDPLICSISSNVKTIFGYTKEDLILNNTPLYQYINQNDHEDLIITIQNTLLSRKKNHTTSFRVNCFDSTIKIVNADFKYIRDKKERRLFIVGYLLDTSQTITFQKRIDYLTYFDHLTGLVNREKIKSIIDDELEQNLKTHTTSAILYLDLNRFKHVNETLGHHIGDKLLQHVSHRLRSCIKDQDTLSRVGDDEFVILLSSLNKNTFYSHIEIIAKRVYKILERPFSIDDNILHITTSIGVAILGVDGNNSDEILKTADIAMVLAKKDQDRFFRYYQSTMKDDTKDHLEIENDLRVAIKQQQFELYYQPQVDVTTNHIVGAEALIRWHHPKKGMISPFKFIPIAEETGLIIAIGEWVLRQSCERIKELQNSENTPNTFKKISVNISSKQFAQPSFTADVKKIIAKSGIDPTFLELEVTEGALISNLEDAIEKMLILKELGIKFSIDDFGTGYSSLTYLKKLPIDIIKIDKSFITNMHADNDDRVLTQTIIQMSQNLRLGLIAEGVEKVEHLNFLQEKGCESYQGYYFSKPLPFAKFKALLLSNEVVHCELL